MGGEVGAAASAFEALAELERRGEMDVADEELEAFGRRLERGMGADDVDGGDAGDGQAFGGGEAAEAVDVEGGAGGEGGDHEGLAVVALGGQQRPLELGVGVEVGAEVEVDPDVAVPGAFELDDEVGGVGVGAEVDGELAGGVGDGWGGGFGDLDADGVGGDATEAGLGPGGVVPLGLVGKGDGVGAGGEHGIAGPAAVEVGDDEARSAAGLDDAGRRLAAGAEVDGGVDGGVAFDRFEAEVNLFFTPSAGMERDDEEVGGVEHGGDLSDGVWAGGGTSGVARGACGRGGGWAVAVRPGKADVAGGGVVHLDDQVDGFVPGDAGLAEGEAGVSADEDGVVKLGEEVARGEGGFEVSSLGGAVELVEGERPPCGEAAEGGLAFGRKRMVEVTHGESNLGLIGSGGPAGWGGGGLGGWFCPCRDGQRPEKDRGPSSGGGQTSCGHSVNPVCVEASPVSSSRTSISSGCGRGCGLL